MPISSRKKVIPAAALAAVLDIRPLNFYDELDRVPRFAGTSFRKRQIAYFNEAIDRKSYLPGRAAVTIVLRESLVNC